MSRTKITLSINELLAELARRQKRLPKLMKMAARLEQKLAALHQEIQALGGSLPAKRGRVMLPKAEAGAKRSRHRNKQSLAEVLISVLSKDAPKNIPTIMADVKKAGYKTSSKNFSTIVYQTLARERNRIAKVGRGLYQLRD